MAGGPNNDFSLLFSYAEVRKRQRDAVECQKRVITDTLSRIFLFSLSKSDKSRANVPKYAVILPQLAKAQERIGRKGTLDVDSLMQV